MNQVSWLIYFANVSGNLGGLLVFLGICVIVVTALYFITSLLQINDVSRRLDSDQNLVFLNTSKKQDVSAHFLW